MDIDGLKLPEEFAEPKVNKRLENLKKAPNRKKTPIIEERERLPRTNRDINCIFCEQTKILNPDQYQAYFDYWGDEEKIARNFCCKECEVKQNENPYRFWLVYHELTRKLIKSLKATFETYRLSTKQQADIVNLQNVSVQLLTENHIESDDIEFITQNGLPVGIKVKHMPFVGAVELLPYNEFKITFHETI